MNRRSRRLREAGLTLVELMVTIVVASLVASSTFVFFAGQQQIYETQSKLLNVQQNLWLAMEVMGRHLRASGTGMVGCGPNGLRAWYQGQGAFRVPPVGIVNGADGAPDEITFSFFTNTSGNYFDSNLTTTISTNYNGSNIKTSDSTPFREGEFLLLFDRTDNPPGGDRGCTLYQITGISGASDLVIANPSSPWNCEGQTPLELVPYDYTPANTGIRNLGTLSSTRFFIDAGAPGQAPRLMVDDFNDGGPPQVLAEGIEDMQLAWACDLQPVGNPDGALVEGTDPASRLLDEWTFNEPGDVPPVGCDVPTAIRITLFGRSLTTDTALFGTGEDGATLSFKPAMEDGVAGAPDQFRHRTLTTTVYPRN